MSKMLANISLYGSFGVYNEYQVTITSGSLATWIGSQFAGNNTPNQPVYVSFLGDLSGATFSITQYVDQNNFYIAGVGSPFSIPAVGVSGINITAAQIWDQGQANTIAYTCSTAPPAYNATVAVKGAFGGDGGASIDLKNAGISGALWMFADSYWIVNGPLSTIPARMNSNLVAAVLIHNCIALQTYNGSGTNAYDATTCKFRYYSTITGSSTTNDTVAYFQPDTQVSGTVSGSQPWTSQYWIAAGTGGYCGNSYSTYISALSMKDKANGVKQSVFWINNISTNPNKWNIQELDVAPFGQDLPVPTMSFFDPYADGYLYSLVSLGAGFTSSTVAGFGLYRIPKGDIVITSGMTPTFMRGEYFMGTGIGWVNASWLQNTTDLGQLPTVVHTSDADSAYPAQLSDGSFVIPSVDWPYGFKLRIAQSDSLTSGWPDINNSPVIMTLPYWDNLGAARWYYQPHIHIEQTWSGKQTDDIVISTAHNNPDVGHTSTITQNPTGSGSTWTFTISDSNGFRFPYPWPSVYSIGLNVKNISGGTGFNTTANTIISTDNVNNTVTITYNTAPSGTPTITLDKYGNSISTIDVTASGVLGYQKHDTSSYWVELIRISGL